MSVTTVAWIYLIIAGILEAFWAIGLKFSEGFTKPIPTTITLVLVLSSFYLLSQSMKVLPVSYAYAVWCAIGIVSLVLIEYLYFQSTLGVAKVISIMLILLGIIGLKIF